MLIDGRPMHVQLLIDSHEVKLLNRLQNKTAGKEAPKSLAARAEYVLFDSQ